MLKTLLVVLVCAVSVTGGVLFSSFASAAESTVNSASKRDRADIVYQTVAVDGKSDRLIQ
jgi:hypothetical protein